MVDPLPTATVRGGTLRRLWGFIAIPPRQAGDGLYAWVISFAGASYLIHAAYFTLVILVGNDGLGVAFSALASLLLGLMVFMTTLVGMAAAQMIGRWLVRLPEPRARRAGALGIAAAACLIEPVGTVFFRSLAEVDWLWSFGRWGIALSLGALWGAWLPGAYRAEEQLRSDPADPSRR